jgi:methionyl-tRNA formyltransferase
MGTPAFALPALQALVAAGHDVACVYSQPPRAAGRGMQEKLSPVAALARARNIELRMPGDLKETQTQQAFAALELDAAIVVAYGLILPPAILSAPRFGCLNLHASLLPRWRGAAPIQRAIMAGDNETGVMIMQMDEGLDTGPVLASEKLAIASRETGGGLHDRLAQTGAQLLCNTLMQLEKGNLHAVPQARDGATYAKKISNAETRIDWMRPAVEVDRHIRALSPAPGAWGETEVSHRLERIKILSTEIVEEKSDPSAWPGTVLSSDLKVACGRGTIKLVTLQRAGKTPQDAASFLRGFRLPPGSLFK